MKTWLIIGACLAGVSVLFGAFGAHGLKTRVSSDDLGIFETAVRYQMYHSLGILFISTLGITKSFPDNILLIPTYLMVAGIIIFSGSLYILVLTNTRWLGAITPIGGGLLIFSWFLLAFNIYRSMQ
ncbi:MAG: hypothetical protein CMG04_00685 [Candidatus Marinimicrobia bacterium]|nr:hypothetical protein [Candidatus Neomarinimicrobiota bacterium]